MTGKAVLIKTLQGMGLSGNFGDLVKGETWNLQATFVNNNAKRVYFYFWVTLRYSDTSTDMNQGIKVQLGNDDEIRVIRKQADKITVDDILRAVYEIAQGLSVAVWEDRDQHLAPYGVQAFLVNTMIGGQFVYNDQAWVILDRRVELDTVHIDAHELNGKIVHKFLHKDGGTTYDGVRRFL